MLLGQLLGLPPHDDRALSVELSGAGTDRPRIAVSGEVDTANAAQLRERMLAVLRHQRPSSLEVDFAGVTFLDAAGVRNLLLCRADAEQAHCQLRLTRVQPAVHRVLEIVGVLATFGLAGRHP
jgi:anti-anti-sigma factor